MKKILIATVATAALAMSAPAFAQVTGDVTGTVQAQTPVAPQAVTDPLAQTTDEAQDVVTETTDEAQEAAVMPPQAEAEVTADAAIPSPTVSAEAAPVAPPEANAEAETAMTASASPQGASAETAVQAAADMPAPVQEAVNDGRYTTDDLNRAQLAALQSPTQGSR